MDILDVFGGILESKPEILFGCRNILDLIITMIEDLEETKIEITDENWHFYSNIDNKNNSSQHLKQQRTETTVSNTNTNTTNKDSKKPSDAAQSRYKPSFTEKAELKHEIETRITTAHCKLCHLISLIGRTQLTVKDLNRLMTLLRDCLLNKNRKLLGVVLLSTLKDMIEHSPPSYGPNNINHHTNMILSTLSNYYNENNVIDTQFTPLYYKYSYNIAASANLPETSNFHNKSQSLAHSKQSSQNDTHYSSVSKTSSGKKSASSSKNANTNANTKWQSSQLLSHEYTKQIYPKIATIHEHEESKNMDSKTRKTTAKSQALNVANQNETNSNNSKSQSTKSKKSHKRGKSFVSVFSDHWFKSSDESHSTDSNTNKNNQSKPSQTESNNSKSKEQKSQANSSSSNLATNKKNNSIGNIPLPNTLLRIIHQLPLSSFAFLHKNSGIIVPTKAFKAWPSPKGFTFCAWILWHQFEPFTRSKTSWMCLYSMLTVSGYGIDISLCNKTGQVKIRIVGKNSVDEKVIPSVRLLSAQWYFLGITHIPSRTAALKILRPSRVSGTCKIYVNGEKVSTVDLSYPPVNEPPRYCSSFVFAFVLIFIHFI